MISTFVIPIVFLIMIILWLWNKIDQMLVSMGGAIISAFSLIAFDMVGFTEIIGLIFGTAENEYLNFHSLLLSLGMLFIINSCQETGVFSYLAYKIVQTTGGSRYQLLIILSTLAFVFSGILNNILAVLLLIPITITTCKILRINAIPYIMTVSIIVNLGSILFIISSVPNILIATHNNWSFSQFFFEIGLFSFILVIISSIFLSGYFKKNLEMPDRKLLHVLRDYDPWTFVKNRKSFYQSITVLIISLSLFIVLPIFTEITIGFIAITGGVILLLINVKDNLSSVMRKLDFELIFYLIGVFFVVDALQFVGALDWLIIMLERITQGNIILSSILVLWMSAGMSSLMNNAPATKIMIPAIDGLSEAFSINPNHAFRSLAYGANLGDNMTPWGDNLVAMKISSDYKNQVNFWKFFKIGLLASFIQLISTNLYILIIINPRFILPGILILLIIFVKIALFYFHKGIYKLLKKVLKRLFKKIR
ncbi:MAG: hypothetical protein GF329_09485 [Candidatus Lokiarchaeota archaeon]|nr:hypothetical protein [Candidatus Lokiarchaeota archaeon]